MRVAAGLVILLLCTLWGCRKSLMLKRRCGLISDLRLLLEHYFIGISCTAPTLDELIRTGQGEFGEILRRCAEENSDIRAAWKCAVGQLSELPHCGKEEAELMSELGRELGTCPAESQLSLLKLYSGRLDMLFQQAEKLSEQKGRLYRSGGVLAGLGAAVLLL
ncbi:MAG: stage III sporulation protein AB [Oscillospiraceae bacterium]